MQTFRAPSFIYTLWNNPIAAPNFPRHKSGDVKVVYNQKVYSFRAKETGRYSTVIANAAQVEINITSECVKLSDSALDKVMQLLAGIANVEIEGSEVLDALQVMIVLGMDSLLEECFDYMANVGFVPLKSPSIIAFNLKTFRKIMRLHKETYMRRQAASNPGRFLLLKEQEELVEEYCNANSLEDRKVQFIMELMFAQDSEEKDTLNELKFAVLYDEVKVLRLKLQQDTGRANGSSGVQVPELSKKVGVLHEEQTILKQGLIEVTGRLNDVINITNSNQENGIKARKGSDLSSSSGPQAKDLQNLLENQAVIAQELDKNVKESRHFRSQMAYVEESCRRLTYLQFYKYENPIHFLFPVDTPPKPHSIGPAKSLRMNGFAQLSVLKDAALNNENIVDLYIDCSKGQDWFWVNEVAHYIARFPNLQKLVLNRCQINYDSNVKYLYYALYNLAQLCHLEIAGFGISKPNPSNDFVIYEFVEGLKGLKALNTVRMFHSKAFPDHCKQGIIDFQELKTSIPNLEIGLWRPDAIPG